MYPVFPYLDNLYLGNLNPNENLSPSEPEFHKLQQQACELEDQIESKLNLLDNISFPENTILTVAISSERTEEAIKILNEFVK